MLTVLATTFLGCVFAGFCLIVLLAILKWLINRSRRDRCDAYRDKFDSYVQGTELESELQRAKHEVLELFQRADVRDVGVSRFPPRRWGAKGVEPATYNPGPLSTFELFPTRRADVVPLIVGKFNEASGTYEHRMRDARNPLYWAESIAYLPRHIAAYLNMAPESLLTKTLTVAYWLIGSVWTLIAAIVGSDLFLEWFTTRFFTP